MPKIAKQLSDRAVAALKAEGRHAVGGVAGLHLRVSAGHRGWVLRVKVGDARKDIGLGAYPVVSLAEARERAWKIHESIREGHAPVAPRRQQRQALLAQAATENLPLVHRRIPQGQVLRVEKCQASPAMGKHPRDLCHARSRGPRRLCD